MITTSTDYAITKRGMSPHLRKRDKPLRTYGKRQQSHNASAEAPPPPKKRKCSNATEEVFRERSTETGPASRQGRQEQEERSAKPHAVAEEAKEPKGSILSYFKRVEVKPVELQTIPTEDEHNQEDKLSRPALRKPRILRLRTTSTTTDTTETHSTTARPPLKESLPSSTNSQPGPPMNKKKKNRREAAVVQTTLNISPQAAFSECKICDTVWNPLWPDDVKYHLKRHAAAIGRKRRMASVDSL